jgi:hypothetical protein
MRSACFFSPPNLPPHARRGGIVIPVALPVRLCEQPHDLLPTGACYAIGCTYPWVPSVLRDAPRGKYPKVPRGTSGYHRGCTPGYPATSRGTLCCWGMQHSPGPPGVHRDTSNFEVAQGTYPAASTPRATPRGYPCAHATTWGMYPGTPRDTTGYLGVSTPYPGTQQCTRCWHIPRGAVSRGTTPG